MHVAEPHDTRAKAEGGEKPLSAKFWLNEIEASGKREEDWRKKANKVVCRYRDERDKYDNQDRRTNILWSNTETLKSVLFQGIGNPDVRRRFPRKGKEERAARQASLVLEHALSYCGDVYDASSEVEWALEDMLLAGRGQCWIVYDADVEEEAHEAGDDETAVPVAIKDQSVHFEHVYWEDYRTSAGRTERDIWWKARRHKYSRDELRKYFPDHADKIPLNAAVAGRTAEKDEEDDTFKRADVWEIWDKTKKQRIYIAEDYPSILRKDADPYELRDFFPCPAALYGCKTTSSLVPIPEYTLYQDQAEELDQITTRLNRLIDALKRRGVYDASLEGADNQLSLLAHAGDNEFVPYKGFASLMEKGGLKGAFQTEDLGPIIAVVERLYAQRMMLVQTIYEVTGISDVIRGASDPNETATAQRIKGQFGSLRIQKRQGKVNAFIRDLYRLKGEIIAEHFEREKLEEMSGIDLPVQVDVDRARQQLQMMQQHQDMMAQQQMAPQMGHNGGPPMMEGAPAMPAPQMPPVDPEVIQSLTSTAKSVPWEEVERILRSDDKRGYKVDIETDATAQVDDQAEKESRIEFLTTMQSFMERIVPAVQAMPQLAPLSKELVIFALKSFKVGRTLEETFDDAFDHLAKQPPHPQTDPVAEAKAKKIESEIEASVMQIKADQAMKQQEMAQKQQMGQIDMAGKVMDLNIKRETAAADMAIAQQESRFKAAEMAQRHRVNQIDAALEVQSRRQKMQTDAEMARQKSQQIGRGY